LKNCSSQRCEASTFLPFENKTKSDFYPNDKFLDNFVLDMHTFVSEQELKKQVLDKVSIYVFVIVYYNEFSDMVKGK